jgi:hypothetical protein
VNIKDTRGKIFSLPDLDERVVEILVNLIDYIEELQNRVKYLEDTLLGEVSDR